MIFFETIVSSKIYCVWLYYFVAIVTLDDKLPASKYIDLI